MSLGIILASPAMAQSTIGGSPGSTVALANTTNYPGGNPFYVEYTATVLTSSGDAIFGDGTQNWTLTNYGTLSGGTANGVQLDNGGTVANQSLYVYDEGTYSGRITGATNGVYIAGAAGTLFNVGAITGAAHDGVELLDGGSVGSYAGTISGALNGIYMQGAYGAVTNAGAGISGGEVDGVHLLDGGSVNNAGGGVVVGAESGVVVDGGGAVSNAGTISGTGNYGVELTNGGVINNISYQSSLYATISGGLDGVRLTQGGTVDNAWLITGGANGIYMDHGGYLSNSSSGTVSGAQVGVLAGYAGALVPGEGTVLNQGLITGGSIGIELYNGGTVTNEGAIFGTAGTGVLLAGGGSVVNNGAIYGLTGISVAAADYVENGAAGYVRGRYNGVVVGAGGSVANSGTIIVNNYISQPGAGIRLASGGGVTNLAGGNVTAYGDGVLVEGAAGTIVNNGLLQGMGNGNVGNGVQFLAGGSVDNAGTIFGMNDGVLGGDDVSISNTGSIYARNYGVLLDGGGVTNAGFIGGNGNAAVEIIGVGTVLNQGTIIGGNIAAVYLGTGYLSNSGTGTISSAGSFGVYGYNAINIVNAGTIVETDGSFVNSFPPAGIALSHGGTVINQAGGLIQGFAGIFARGNTSIVNAGSIQGQFVGVGLLDDGSLVNAAGGMISGGLVGVYIAGSTSVSIDNLQGATIVGGNYGAAAFGPVATVYNAGLIQTSGTVGLALIGGGSVTNAAGGTIAGGGAGILANEGPASIVNDGQIIGAAGAGITLDAGGFVTNAVGGTISGYTYGIISNSYASSIDNAGLITASNGAGVALNGAGTLTNSGTVIGTTAGVLLGAGGSVGNTGTISGGASGVVAYQYAATVTNSGSIGAGSGDAIGLTMGGYVGNAAGGVITSNAIAVDIGGPGSLSNGGIVTGGTYGVLLAGGDTVTNTGTITGGIDGVAAPSGATVVNSGVITGTANDGVLLLGGSLTNNPGAVIKGGTNGLYAAAGAGISNGGTIMDDGTAGAMLGDGVTMLNSGGGLVQGATGIAFNGAGASVLNNGTIASSDGGDAVSFDAAGTNSLTLASGTVLIGSVDGGGSNSTIDLVGTGTINNTIASFGAGSSLTVQPGAYWTATGNWTVATVFNDGTFEAGTLNPDPPLYLTGNFVQGSMGTLQVVVTPTMSTQFIVTGTAKVAGTLKYIFTPGTYTPHDYDFLTASGGVTGNFSTVNYSGDVPPTIAIAHSTTQGPAVDTLVLSTGAGTPGQHRGGNVIVTPADDTVFSAEAEAEALDAQQANDSLLGHAAGAVGGDDAARAAACQAAMHVPNDSTSSTASRMASAFASAFCGAGGWMEATGTALHVDGSDGAPDLHADTGGFLAGIDRPVGNIGARLGLAVGYDETWLHDGAGGKGTVGTTRVGLYGATPLGRLTLAGDVMYGHASNDTSRATGIGQARAGYGSDIYAGALQLTEPLVLNGFALSPAAGLRVAHVDGDSFTESGAGYVPYFAVSGATPDVTSVQPFVKLGITRSYVMPNYLVITPAASIGYHYEAGDRGQAANVNSQDGTAFSTSANHLNRSAAEISASLTAGKGNWSLYARYNAYLSNNWTAQTGEAGVQMKF